MQFALPPGTALRQYCSLPVMLELGVWACVETTEAATRAKPTINAFMDDPFLWQFFQEENSESAAAFPLSGEMIVAIALSAALPKTAADFQSNGKTSSCGVRTHYSNSGDVGETAMRD